MKRETRPAEKLLAGPQGAKRTESWDRKKLKEIDQGVTSFTRLRKEES